MKKGYIVCVYESISDENVLKNYAVKAREAVNKYDGKFLVRGNNNIVTEGKNFVRTAVIEFLSFQKAKEFWNSIIYLKVDKNAYSSFFPIFSKSLVATGVIFAVYFFHIFS